MNEISSERVWLDGPAGRLAGELSYGGGAMIGAALLIPPHPYMGGRMRLPLMTQIAEALARHEITTLRFDYAGVGDSEGPKVHIGAAMQQFWSTGQAPEDPGRVQEAAAARAWLRVNVAPVVALVGYSFGASIAAHLNDDATCAVVMIAPTVKRHDYSAFRNDHTPTLIVYGDGDFATSDDQMHAWTSSLAGPTELRHFKAGDHFFRGIEADVATAVAAFLSGVLAVTPEARD